MSLEEIGANSWKHRVNMQMWQSCSANQWYFTSHSESGQSHSFTSTQSLMHMLHWSWLVLLLWEELDIRTGKTPKYSDENNTFTASFVVLYLRDTYGLLLITILNTHFKSVLSFTSACVSYWKEFIHLCNRLLSIITMFQSKKKLLRYYFVLKLSHET